MASALNVCVNLPTHIRNTRVYCVQWRVLVCIVAVRLRAWITQKGSREHLSLSSFIVHALVLYSLCLAL